MNGFDCKNSSGDVILKAAGIRRVPVAAKKLDCANPTPITKIRTIQRRSLKSFVASATVPAPKAAIAHNIGNKGAKNLIK